MKYPWAWGGPLDSFIATPLIHILVDLQVPTKYQLCLAIYSLTLKLEYNPKIEELNENLSYQISAHEEQCHICLASDHSLPCGDCDGCKWYMQESVRTSNNGDTQHIPTTNNIYIIHMYPLQYHFWAYLALHYIAIPKNMYKII
jgi:hypothetical protein